MTMDVSFIKNVPYFTKKSVQGEEPVEPKFWEISEPLPSIVLDIPFRKENKETKFTKFESKIGPLEEEILQMKIRKILSLWFIQEN